MTKFYLILCFCLIAIASVFAQKPTTPIPVSVIYKTEKGISGRGAIEFLRNDTLCIRDERENVLFLSLSRLASCEFFDAEGKHVSVKKGDVLKLEPFQRTVEFAYLPTDTVKTGKTRVKITLKKGTEINGNLLWRRGDSVAVDAGLGQPILLTLGQIDNIRRVEASEKRSELGQMPKKNETTTSKDAEKVQIQTKDGKTLTGRVLWKSEDSITVDAGLEQPIVLPMAQVERISAKTRNENSMFRSSRPGEKFDNYTAQFNLVARAGFPIQQGQNYVRLMSGIGFSGANGYEVGLRLNDYFKIQVNSIASIFIMSATPSAIFPITSSFYANAGVNFGFNVFTTDKIFQINGYTAGLAVSQPSFSVGLQFSRLRGVSQFIPTFSNPQKFYRNHISLPFQYRITQNWLFLAEFTVSPFSDNVGSSVIISNTPPFTTITPVTFQERVNHVALAGRYLQPRYFVDFGLGFARKESRPSTCIGCENRNLPSASAGAGVLFGKRNKK